jgi:hypothetical protein
VLRLVQLGAQYLEPGIVPSPIGRMPLRFRCVPLQPFNVSSQSVGSYHSSGQITLGLGKFGVLPPEIDLETGRPCLRAVGSLASASQLRQCPVGQRNRSIGPTIRFIGPAVGFRKGDTVMVGVMTTVMGNVALTVVPTVARLSWP